MVVAAAGLATLESGSETYPGDPLNLIARLRHSKIRVLALWTAVAGVIITIPLAVVLGTDFNTIGSIVTVVAPVVSLIVSAIKVSGPRTITEQHKADALRAIRDRELAKVYIRNLSGTETTAIPLVLRIGGSEPAHQLAAADFTQLATATAPTLLLGGPGSGKTLLMRSLAEEMLRSDPARTPITIPLARWDGIQDFGSFVFEQVDSGIDPRVARRVRREKQFLLIFDSLDEMGDDERHVKAIAVLDWGARSRHPVVVVSRTDLARRLQRSVGSTAKFTVATLLPVDSATALEFLDHEVSADILDALRADLRDRPKGRLAAALNSPWALQLAAVALRTNTGRATFTQHLGKLPDHESVARLHTDLLTQFVKVQANSYPRRRRQDPGAGRAFYSEQSIHRWCSQLVDFLVISRRSRIGGDIAPLSGVIPHRLWAISGVNRTRLVAIGLSFLLWLPFNLVLALELLNNGRVGAQRWAMFGVPIGAMFLSASLAFTPVRPIALHWARLTSIEGTQRLIAGGIASAAVGLPVGVFAAHVAFSAWFTVGFTLVFAFAFAIATRPEIDDASVLVVGALVGLALHIVCRGIALQFGSIVGFGGGLCAGVFAVSVGVLAGLSRWRQLDGRGGWIDQPEFESGPFARLQSDLRAGILPAAASGVEVFLVAHQSKFLAEDIPLSALLAVTSMIAVGPGFISNAWRRYAAMRVLVVERLPLRLHSFFDWCVRAGLMRAVAGAYEFRHPTLESLFGRPNPGDGSRDDWE